MSVDSKVGDLTEDDLNRVREVIDKEHLVEGDLRRQVQQNIRRLVEVNTYRGIRHRRGLPVTRTEDQDQRQDQEGSEADGGRAQAGQGQEVEVNMAKQKGRSRRREKKFVPVGRAYIQSTFNNTKITLTDPNGNVIAWGSSGTMGFKGSRKGTAFAAQRAADQAARKGTDQGLARSGSLRKGTGKRARRLLSAPWPRQA